MAQKKVRDHPRGERLTWIEAGACGPDLKVQCALCGISRSGWYYEPQGESLENIHVMRLLDEQYTKTPFYGVRRMVQAMAALEVVVNAKRVRRLLQLMGLEAIYPKPSLSRPAPGHRVYPYLLRGVPVMRPDQVWSSDITYVRLRSGFVYLVAVIDWFSRYVLAWEVSTSLESDFCVSALQWALRGGRPDVFNTDQGAQFTSESFTSVLTSAQIAISMDGRGRALDNVFVERLWRSVKYEDIYLKEYVTVAEVIEGLRRYFTFYNTERPHQSLGYRTPLAVYRSR